MVYSPLGGEPVIRSALGLFVAFLVLVVAQVDAGDPEVVPVESRYVCMVNDTLFQKEQIPVEVEGKTYFGCCEMCKARLSQDAGTRTATDPVTGEAVDKATAVIAAQADGDVLYFESEETLRQYSESR